MQRYHGIESAEPLQVTYPLDLVRTRLAYGLENGSGNASLDAVRRLSGAAAAVGPGSAAAASAATLPHQQQALHAAQHHPKRATIRGVLASTVRQEGALGLYRGIGPTLCGILPYAGLKFYVYQSLKQQYRRWPTLTQTSCLCTFSHCIKRISTKDSHCAFCMSKVEGIRW